MRKITPEEITLSPFSGISKGWSLICAGDREKNNFMTASWGFMGHMWGKDCAIAAVRPQRYTIEFMEKQDTFSMCLMDGQCREEMNFCGSKSGRDFDKAAETGLTVGFSGETPYVEQAKFVLVCKKLYVDSLKKENFLDGSIPAAVYAADDYHKMFYGEIVEVLAR
ncbi:MAG: flavin reductase [Oscillospiraceae bacterium]|nr:flavin reductase [Oscillospiraceae bacterium]